MALRPVPTRWFELLTMQRHLPQALDCLARTGAVELETRSTAVAALLLPDLGTRLAEHDGMAERYSAYWPQPAVRRHEAPGSPQEMLDGALARLRVWADEAHGIIERLQARARERGELRLLQKLLTASKGALPNLERLTAAGPALNSAAWRLAPKVWPQEFPANLIHQRVETPGGAFLLAVGPQAEMALMEGELKGLKARPVALPAWLVAKPEKAVEQVAGHLADLDHASMRDRAALDDLAASHDLAAALGDIALLKWLNAHAPEIGGTDRLAWVTGWTSDIGGEKLQEALECCDVYHLLSFRKQPRDASPPMVLNNPAWARQFEIFARMLGMPGLGEADPSPVVALIAPLLFGYMFGDVGQGLVLLVAGLTLRRKMPALAILIPGGVMSMIFGVLFGSVFAREDIIPALWLHPLDQPITLLAVSVAAGVLILTVGLVLDAVQAHWRGQGGQWWQSRAGYVLAYFGLVAGVAVHAQALWLALAGAVWFIGGAAFRNRAAGALRAAGELVESLVQLGVNTVSFARAGAFALAHAGLSVAIIGLADAAGPSAYWFVLLVGNAFIIALEGLIVSIQTTRLLLFEFFVRFLHAGGRAFHPLAPPGRLETRLEGESS